MKIDETNIAILHHLRDGRVSFKKIAEGLSISEGTVRSRVKKIQDVRYTDMYRWHLVGPGVVKQRKKL